MDAVTAMVGYATSKDYVALMALMQKQSVICIVDYRDDSDIRDVAHTIYHLGSKGKGVWQVSARGYGYIYAFSPEDFMTECAKQNLEFVLPSSVMPEPGPATTAVASA